MNTEMNNSTNAIELAPGAVVEKNNHNPKLNALDGSNGIYNHQFKKPFEYEGQKYTTLNFNFNKLTGKDMKVIEQDMQSSNESAYAPEFSRLYQYRLAARAAGVTPNVIEAMPIGEFNRICNAARNFLLATGY